MGVALAAGVQLALCPGTVASPPFAPWLAGRTRRYSFLADAPPQSSIQRYRDAVAQALHIGPAAVFAALCDGAPHLDAAHAHAAVDGLLHGAIAAVIGPVVGSASSDDEVFVQTLLAEAARAVVAAPVVEDRLFAALDTNTDRLVDAAEFAAALAPPSIATLQMLLNGDRNDTVRVDGVVAALVDATSACRCVIVMVIFFKFAVWGAHRPWLESCPARPHRPLAWKHWPL